MSMKPILNFTIRALRKLFGNKGKIHPLKYYEYVDLFDQQANDYIYRFLTDDSIKGGKMISKFGTTELSNIVAGHYELHHWNIEYLKDFFSYNVSCDLHRTLHNLCMLSGFFPYDVKLGKDFYYRMLRDMPEIDVLASYIYQEKYVKQFLTGIKKRVNLDGFYAHYL